jgi:hypothetical protein
MDVGKQSKEVSLVFGFRVKTILNKIPKIVQNFWILVESGVSFEQFLTVLVKEPIPTCIFDTTVSLVFFIIICIEKVEFGVKVFLEKFTFF